METLEVAVSHKKAPRTRVRTVVRQVLPKKRKWSKNALKTADSIFSKKIIARDKHCLFPDCTRATELTCSHYIGRANKSTRFYEDNCIALCWFHHYGSKLLGFEYQKQRIPNQEWDGRYTIFMKEWLGEKRFLSLLKKSEIQMKPKEIREMVFSIVDTNS